MQDIVESYRSRPAPLTSIPAPAVAAIDALQRAIALAEARIVAIAAPHAGSAAGEITRMLARNFAASGVRTLIVSASGTTNRRPAPTWRPGEPLPADMIEPGHDSDAPDHVTLSACRSSRATFNNINRVRRTLSDEFASYGAIVCHLAPLLGSSDMHLNPVSIARAADAAYLVCTNEQTSVGDVRKAQEVLDTASVKIGGMLLDAPHVTPRSRRWAISCSDGCPCRAACAAALPIICAHRRSSTIRPERRR
jgi:Mrp family chromosome partitioning ATPase